MKIAGFIICAAGIILHTYISFLKSQQVLSGFNLGLFAASLLPYLICGFLFLRSDNLLIPLIGIIPCLAMDLISYYSVFIRPESSTAPLSLVAAPLYNLVLFMPAGMLTGWLVSKLIKKI